MQFYLFFPQMRVSLDRLVELARSAEAAGFGGIVGMDHMAPPRAKDQPMYEALIANTWLAAHTERIHVGSLVMCDALRHPAMLARQAVSIDRASGGRFELGIGWGSFMPDFTRFGFTPTEPSARVRRLRETLEVLKALWSGEAVDYDGEFHHLQGAVQAPTPLSTIPILIGGSGPKTLALVSEFADWWNFDVRYIDKLESDEFKALRGQVGAARVSVQQMVAYVGGDADRTSVEETAMRRFEHSHPIVGTGAELADYYGKLSRQGVERVYVWFCDFAPPETVAAFGEEVIKPLGPAAA
jgi:alkanesulfonate monooxygenase SsuD/methylene tetrahydromethanopterin reductase-like flavin-dependent oxidoreductase (luciferase family)